MAQRFQQGTERTLLFLSLLVFLAASLFETYEIGRSPWFLLFYPLFLSVVYVGWVLGVKRGKWQDKYQDHRALAEGLRVAFFWRLIGQNVSGADHSLRRQRSEMDWIRMAIRNTVLAQDVVPTAQDEALETLPGEVRRERWNLAVKHWVEDQSKYFTHSAIPKMRRTWKRRSAGSRGCFWAAGSFRRCSPCCCCPGSFPKRSGKGLRRCAAGWSRECMSI